MDELDLVVVHVEPHQVPQPLQGLARDDAKLIVAELENLQRPEVENVAQSWDSLSLPQGTFEPRSPALQADSLPAEPPGKPKNIGVGSTSLLQRIFPIQECNQGLLHCRQILYQLSYLV